jgi:hypothetical protein
MKNWNFLFMSLTMMGLLASGCATDDRQPAYSRSGRESQEPRAMNHRSLDSNTLYQACLRERSEVSCRNRLGR